MKICKECKEQLTSRSQKIYCSNSCQMESQYKTYIKQWKSGSKKVSSTNISKHIKRYFINKHGEKCSLCGWSKKHPLSGKVPLEIDHRDGISTNNHEGNLRLICPNCHSLTENYKNLNRGKGRVWRKDRYKRLIRL